MVKLYLRFALLYFIFCLGSVSTVFAQNFITTWKTDNPGPSGNTSITIPTTGTGYNYTVEWEEIGNPANSGSLTDITGNVTIDFGIEGEYRVEISGSFPRIFFSGLGDRQKILSVEQWGGNAWTSMVSAFRGCTNLEITASDAPNLSGVTDLSIMFLGATSLNQSIDHWDVSTITNMSSLFNGASTFNQPLNSWDVSNVVNMASMFFGASVFNQDLNNWDIGNVTTMSSMFRNAFAFDGDITTWDVSSVTTMFEMFVFTPFNQDIGSWNTSSVSNMSRMFNANFVFNQNIDAWDVSNVTTMAEMFNGAREFNQPLNNWNVSNVTTMDRMFTSARDFNQDLNNWDVGNVTNMGAMFRDANRFNGDISTWDVSSVTTMFEMFRWAYDFNQDIGEWDVGNVINMVRTFSFTNSFNQDIGSWDVSSVTDMSGMFTGASVFNQDISGWDVQNVTNMTSMFSLAGAFNQTIGSWDISSVTNMTGMFSSNWVFNQDLSGWDVSNVQFMNNMFWGALAFNQSLGSWDISNITSLNNFLRSSGLSTANYDATLIGWSNLPSLQTGVNLDARTLTYCLGEDARNLIISTYGWTIDDDGLNCGPSITSFTPTSATSGETVTITGSNFTAATEVTFGGIAASSFTVVNATTITAVVGSGDSGDVEVTTPEGTGSLAGFIFNSGPTITIGIQPQVFSSGCLGDQILLSITAFGTTNITYQWQKYDGSEYVNLSNSAEFSGVTTDILTISTTENSAGIYRCEIDGDDTDPVYSDNAEVDVIIPSIPGQGTLTFEGEDCGPGSYTLRATGALSGDIYQWYTTPTGGTPISGFEDAEFETPFLTETQLYYVSILTSEGCESERVAIEATISDAPESETVLDGNRLMVSTGAASYQWYNDDQMIPGATMHFLDLFEFGYYTARIESATGCVVFTEPVLFLVTELEVHSLEDLSFSAFPNPSSGRLEIHWPVVSASVQAQVYDLQGRLVREDTLTGAGSAAVWDMEGLRSGVYYLWLEIPEAKVVKRIMITK